MEFDRSQIFAPVQADTVPRFAQRPRPAAPGLLDQLPSTNISQTKNKDRLRILVRGVPDHVSPEEVEKHLIEPFKDLIDSWYLVRQDFVADLDLDLDQETPAKSCTRVYVQLHNREGVQKFHSKIHGDFGVAQNWSKNPDQDSDSEKISDNIPTPLQVEYSPLPYFTPDPVSSEIMAGTIESDPLYIKFCENPDQLLFEGGEGRVLEPVVAPTEFEVESIVPVGVPLAKIEIPEAERVTIPEEMKPSKKKSKKGKDKKEKEKEKDKKPEKVEETKQPAKQKDKGVSREASAEPRNASSREGTPSEDKKKKRTRKKKPATATSEVGNTDSPPVTPARPAAASASSVPEASSSASQPVPESSSSTSVPAQTKPKAKKKKAREPKETRESPRESSAPPDPSSDSTTKDSREPQAPKKAPKKKAADKPKKDNKSESKPDPKSDTRPKQQPGKENQPKPKPKPQQTQAPVSVPQTTSQAGGAQNGAEKAAPKKKRTRSKKPAATSGSAPASSASTTPTAAKQ